MSNELDAAALKILSVDLGHGPSYMTFELGLSGATQAALDRQRDAIEDYRRRVSGFEADVRQAYEKWLDYFQRENDAARQEMESGIRRKAWLEHEQRQRDEWAAIDRRAATLPRP